MARPQGFALMTPARLREVALKAAHTSAQVRSARRTPATFWSRVDQTGECWIWRGRRTRLGYGQWNYQCRCYSAHRLAWIFTHGPIPTVLCVCHHCDTPACVRPDHLFVGTHHDNMQDKMRKGRHSQRGLRGPYRFQARLRHLADQLQKVLEK